ncbi:MAG: iron-sulfur cluster repair di-iron protein [Acidobacteriota bacterium]
MNLTATQTVGELAVQSLEALRMFEERGIDFCCGGQRPLEQVCRKKGIDAQELLAQVEAMEKSQQAPGRDWTGAPLGELIEHIVTTHHAYLRRELPVIQQRTAKVLAAHGERHGASLTLLARVFGEMRAELETHMQKEERMLFPAIVQVERAAAAGRPWLPLPFGRFGNPIEVMEDEHDSTGRALEAMRRLAHNYTPPSDACNTFRVLYAGLAELEHDLHLHIHLENNILFPRAIALEREAA